LRPRLDEQEQEFERLRRQRNGLAGAGELAGAGIDDDIAKVDQHDIHSTPGDSRPRGTTSRGRILLKGCRSRVTLGRAGPDSDARASQAPKGDRDSMPNASTTVIELLVVTGNYDIVPVIWSARDSVRQELAA
jgi:hypothetical protein